MVEPRMKTYLWQIVFQVLEEKKTKKKALKYMLAYTKSISLNLNHKNSIFFFYRYNCHICSL